ncbi:MAG: branched-chain amino acid ABC transporter permease [Reyranellaceae bacterium]
MKHWPLLLLLVVLGLLPLAVNSHILAVLTLIFYYGFLGQAWNIIGGYGGQLSFGHAAFFGCAAYVTVMLSMTIGLTPWIGMFVGSLAAGVLGAAMGYLGFRFGLRGFYFALLTVAVAEIARIIAHNTEAIGGGVGLFITYTGNPAEFQFSNPMTYCYVAFTMMLIATGIVWLIEHSKFGTYLTAIREDEEAAASLGVNVFLYKMFACTLSAFLTGFGGAFYAYHHFSLQPDSVFGMPLSVEIVIRPIIGGLGTVAGPILGSLLLSPLGEISRTFFAEVGRPGAHLIVYGALLMAVALFMPGGIVSLLRRLNLRRPRS